MSLLNVFLVRGSVRDGFVMLGMNGQKVELKINTKVECSAIIERTEK